MTRAEEWKGPLAAFIDHYRYQADLTADLDTLGSAPFTQDVINEIVLWKVNRYAKLSPSGLEALNSVTAIQPKAHRTAAAVLAALLRESGVDIAMASTFLRFRNKKAFQIIDRHAYRAIYGKDYPLHASSSDADKIELYFLYLDELYALADSKQINFQILDRVLYVFDKQINGKL